MLICLVVCGGNLMLRDRSDEAYGPIGPKTTSQVLGSGSVVRGGGPPDVPVRSPLWRPKRGPKGSNFFALRASRAGVRLCFPLWRLKRIPEFPPARCAPGGREAGGGVSGSGAVPDAEPFPVPRSQLQLGTGNGERLRVGDSTAPRNAAARFPPARRAARRRKFWDPF